MFEENEIISGVFTDSEYFGRAILVKKDGRARVIVYVGDGLGEMEFTPKEFIKSFNYADGRSIPAEDVREYRTLECRRSRFEAHKAKYDRYTSTWEIKSGRHSRSVDGRTFATCYKPIPDVADPKEFGTVLSMRVHSGLRIVCKFVTKSGVYSEMVHVEERGNKVDYRIQSKVILRKDAVEAYKTVGNLTKAVAKSVREQVFDNSNHVLGFEVYDLNNQKVYTV